MLANITQITDMIWIGGDTDPDNAVAEQQIDEIINHTNIKRVLDLRLEWNDAQLWAHNDPSGVIEYKWLGEDDNGNDLSPEWWEEGLNYIYDSVVEHESPVLIHCHMGINRAPSLAGVALVAIYGYNPLHVWREIRSARPMAWCYYLPNGYRWLAETIEVDDPDRASQLLYAADSLEHLISQHKDEIHHTIRTVRKMERERAIVNQSSVTKNM